MNLHEILVSYPQGLVFINEIVKHAKIAKHIVVCAISKQKEKFMHPKETILVRCYSDTMGVQEIMNLLEDSMVKGDLPILIFTNQREEKEMKSSILALTLASVLHQTMRPIGDSIHTRIILGAICQKDQAPFANIRQHRRHHSTKSTQAGHSFQMKLKLPRGIHRDGHGRPQIQRLTPARLTRRNGSRK